MPQVGEVEEGHEGSGDDDHPWLEAACHKLFDAKRLARIKIIWEYCEDCRFATFTKKLTFPVCRLIGRSCQNLSDHV